MAAHQYWRLTGFLTDSNALELSQAQLYDGTTLIAQAPTFTVPPDTGAAFPDVLRWDDFSMPGFALVWNLSTPVANPNLRLGAGASAATFPKELVCQYSDDGKFWSTNKAPANVAFPGAGLLTAAPGAGGGGGVVAGLVTDFSEVTGHAYIDAADAYAKWATELGVFSTGTVSTIDGDDSSVILDLGFPVFSGSAENRILYSTESGFVMYRDIASNINIVSRTDPITKGEASVSRMLVMEIKPDLELCVRESVLDSGTFNGKWRKTTSEAIFFYRTAHYSGPTANGAMDVAVRISTGEITVVATPVNTAIPRIQTFEADAGVLAKGTVVAKDFTSTVVYASGQSSGAPVFIPLSETPAPKRWRLFDKGADRIAGAEMPASNVRVIEQETSFMDAYHGGRGVIRATVKRKNTPENTPLRRRVDLLDERSRLAIRSTWSDPVTGIYVFAGIREDLVYTVVSYDPLHSNRAVIADNLTLANGGVELMP